MKKNYKKIIVIIVAALIVVLGLVLTYFKVFYSDKYYTYIDEEYKFKYSTNYRVERGEKSYTLRDINKGSTITILIYSKKDLSLRMDNINDARGVMKKNLNDSLYVEKGFNCVDHVCSAEYKKDKKVAFLELEFREDASYLYRMDIKEGNVDALKEKFELTTKSFVETKKSSE